MAWAGILGLFCSLPAFASDLYISAFPTIAEEFASSDALVEYTMVTTMVGAACGQAFVGPLSDRFGRKRPLLIGLFVHCIMSLCCAFAGSVYQLMFFRFFQGAANATANVIALAINRDLFTGRTLAQMLSRLVLIIGVAPILAPAIGSILIEFSSWRFVFVFLSLIGMANWVIAWFGLPDTHPRDKRIKQINFGKIIHIWARVFKDVKFFALAVNNGVVSVVVMSWVIASPFIAETDWHFTELMFALTFAVTGAGMICGSQLNAHLVTKISPRRILRIAQPLQLSLIAAMSIVSFQTNSPVVLLPFLFAVIACANPISSNANSIALADKGDVAGTASGILGVMMTILPAIFSPLVAMLGNTFSMMTIVMLGAATISSLLLIFGAKIYQPQSE
jgi:DHA1 family bicyclomycin/chloramphenicol resistance-like MFS transporter